MSKLATAIALSVAGIVAALLFTPLDQAQPHRRPVTLTGFGVPSNVYGNRDTDPSVVQRIAYLRDLLDHLSLVLDTDVQPTRGGVPGHQERAERG